MRAAKCASAIVEGSPRSATAIVATMIPAIPRLSASAALLPGMGIAAAQQRPDQRRDLEQLGPERHLLRDPERGAGDGDEHPGGGRPRGVHARAEGSPRVTRPPPARRAAGLARAPGRPAARARWRSPRPGEHLRVIGAQRDGDAGVEQRRRPRRRPSAPRRSNSSPGSTAAVRRRSSTSASCSLSTSRTSSARWRSVARQWIRRSGSPELKSRSPPTSLPGAARAAHLLAALARAAEGLRSRHDLERGIDERRLGRLDLHRLREEAEGKARRDAEAGELEGSAPGGAEAVGAALGRARSRSAARRRAPPAAAAPPRSRTRSSTTRAKAGNPLLEVADLERDQVRSRPRAARAAPGGAARSPRSADSESTPESTRKASISESTR